MAPPGSPQRKGDVSAGNGNGHANGNGNSNGNSNGNDCDFADVSNGQPTTVSTIYKIGPAKTNRYDNPVIRCSIRKLSDVQKEDFLVGFQRLQQLPTSSLYSFSTIAGFHGLPFLPVEEDAWGGWCNHGNVLFPTWHRAHMRHFEIALQTVMPDSQEPMALHYWEWDDEESVPDLLTKKSVTINGHHFDPNPLYQYTFQEKIPSFRDKGDSTVRYPFSGEHIKGSDEHNRSMKEKYPTEEEQIQALNENITNHLYNNGQKDGIIQKLYRCMQEKNYNVFSNTTSSNNLKEGAHVSLEHPHNGIHLSLGVSHGESNGEGGANGDMGVPESAGFDPIFFLHHSNMDRLFWIWQEKHGKTKKIIIDPEDNSETKGWEDKDKRGTKPSKKDIGHKYVKDSLDMETPLRPFIKTSGEFYTSNDCVDITKMGYKYDYVEENPNWKLKGRGREFTLLSAQVKREVDEEEDEEEDVVNKYLQISDIDQSAIIGSFMIHVYFRWNGKKILIGQEFVFKRWNMSNCGNCQNRYLVDYKFPLKDLPGEVTDIKEQIVVTFHHKVKNDQMQLVDVDTDLNDMEFPVAPTLTIWNGMESNDQLLWNKPHAKTLATYSAMGAIGAGILYKLYKSL